MAGSAARVFQPSSGSAQAQQLPALRDGCPQPDSIGATLGTRARHHRRDVEVVKCGLWGLDTPRTTPFEWDSGDIPNRPECLGEQAVGRSSLISPSFPSHHQPGCNSVKERCHQTERSPKDRRRAWEPSNQTRAEVPLPAPGLHGTRAGRQSQGMGTRFGLGGSRHFPAGNAFGAASSSAGGGGAETLQEVLPLGERRLCLAEHREGGTL